MSLRSSGGVHTTTSKTFSSSNRLPTTMPDRRLVAIRRTSPGFRPEAIRGCQVDLDLDGRFLGDTHDVSARDVRDDCDGLPDGAGALLERVEVLAVHADDEV
jgi:hypothetical protein